MGGFSLSGVMEAARHTKKTLYVVAGLYVVVGFAIALASAANGDRLGTFLGFVIISGAIATAVIIRLLVRVTMQTCAATDELHEVRRRLVRVESVLGEIARSSSAPSGGGGSISVDLAAMGRGDPSALAAATLDRSLYPRLVRTMEEAPPPRVHHDVDRTDRLLEDAATAAETVGSAVREAAALQGAELSDGSGAAPAALDGDVAAGPETKNLLRQWKAALNEDDLRTCGEIYSGLIDTLGVVEVEPLRVQMEHLGDRLEVELRGRFSDAVRQKDFALAMEIGREIVRSLPDRRVAEDFRRIEPVLERKASIVGVGRPLVGHL